MSRPRRLLYVQFHLVVPFVFSFLVADVSPDRGLIQTNGGNEIATCPENFSGEVLTSAEVPGYRYRGFPLQIADYCRYRVLWRNADAYVDMIAHQMAFQNLTTFLVRKLMKYLAQLMPHAPYNRCFLRLGI